MYTEGIASKVDRIQIIFKNPILIVDLLLQFHSDIHLLNLTLYLTLHLLKLGNLAFILVRPLFRQYIVLNELLRNRTRTLTEIHRFNVCH